MVLQIEGRVRNERKPLAKSSAAKGLQQLRYMMAVREQNAKAVGLRYGTDAKPGIRRLRAGSGFRYVAPHGRAVRDAATLARIKSLVIPPAWTNVWIALDPRSHLQATGRDARGRKQYRYHPRWKETSHQTKYSRMVPFGRALPGIRAQVAAHLRQSALCKSKVLAAIVQLLEQTFIRVGNEEYARTNGSFGLTTLRDRHVKVRGEAIQFEFKGKSGVRQRVTLNNRRLARIVEHCQDLPGQELFQYIDDAGRAKLVTSADVNDYLRAAAGDSFSAKDFRTWAGTLIAARELSRRDQGHSQRRTKSTLVDAVKVVSQHLGNTPSVCRACYIHPAVIEAYADRTLHSRLARKRRVRGLNGDEASLLALLESQRTWREQLAESTRVA
jgi:DNA topoisomerase-1